MEKYSEENNSLMREPFQLNNQTFISPQIQQPWEEIESEERQFQKMYTLGKISCGIAHDFKNILTTILSYAELAKGKETPNSSEYLQSITMAAIRGQNLVQQILLFGSSREQHLQVTNLATVIIEVLQLLRISLPSTIKIHTEQASLPSFVLGDSTQISQIVMNLCLNAVDSMRPMGGTLDVSLSHINMEREHLKDYPKLSPGPFAKLRIRDTGSGIPRHILDQIFNPFFTTKKSGQGNGMGLTIVLDVVTRLQGMISLHSVPNEGTTIDIYLPKISEPVETMEITQESPLGGDECILFVDDEDSICQLVQETLIHCHYTVITQTSSQKALDVFLICPDRFDLVITDLSMPYFSGEEFIKNLRRHRPDIPIILSTGLDWKFAHEKARELNVQTSILKPFTPQALVTTIRQVLGRNG